MESRPQQSGSSPPPCIVHRAGMSAGVGGKCNTSFGGAMGGCGGMGMGGPPYGDRDLNNPFAAPFKKPTKNKNIRKRRLIEDDEAEEEEEVSKSESAVLISRRKSLSDNKNLYFSTGPPKLAVSSEKSKGQILFKFESSSEVQVQNDSRATATLETETDFSRDTRAIRERVLKQAETALKGKNKSGVDDKLYKGINAYTDHRAGFRREQTVAGGFHGPLRASAHIRVSARFDYQPDICKDYKETGYCGYGDACKFLHDRGDYKSGWQLEKEWEEKEKARKKEIWV